AGVGSEGIFGPAGTGGTEGFFGRVSFAAIAGGSASVLTGGKFANGALTAAFAQMWNGEGGSDIWKSGPFSNDPVPVNSNPDLLAKGIEGITLSDTDYLHIVAEYSGAVPG